MADSQVRGLDGWLLILAISLTFRPLIDLLSVLGAVVLMIQSPEARLLLGLYAALTGAIMVYTARIAYLLWRLRPSFLDAMRTYFGVLLAYFLVVAALRFLPHGAFLREEEFLQATGRASISGTVYIALWVAYLRYSKRVANTFALAPPPATAA